MRRREKLSRSNLDRSISVRFANVPFTPLHRLDES